MTEVILVCGLTLVAAGVGTATGFGTSTIMIPVMTLFVPLPIVLLFVGIIHLCGDVWKVLLFKSGLDWKLILGFGISGIVASYIGASLSLQAQGLPLSVAGLPLRQGGVPAGASHCGGRLPPG